MDQSMKEEQFRTKSDFEVKEQGFWLKRGNALLKYIQREDRATCSHYDAYYSPEWVWWWDNFRVSANMHQSQLHSKLKTKRVAPSSLMAPCYVYDYFK